MLIICMLSHFVSFLSILPNLAEKMYFHLRNLIE